MIPELMRSMAVLFAFSLNLLLLHLPEQGYGMSSGSLPQSRGDTHKRIPHSWKTYINFEEHGFFLESEPSPAADDSRVEMGDPEEEGCFVLDGIGVPQEEIVKHTVTTRGLPDREEKYCSHIRFASSLFAATVSSGIFYPLDQIKLRLQAGETYRQAFRPKQLYLGFANNGLMMCITNMITTLTYETLREQGTSPTIAALASSTGSLYLTNAGWVYNTRKRLSPEGAPYTWLHFGKEVQQSPRLFFRGISVNTILIAPHTAYLIGNEWLLPRVKEHSGGISPKYRSFVEQMTSATVSNIVATGIFYPLSPIRTLMYKKNLSFPEAVREINLEGGLWGTRVWRSAPIALALRALNNGAVWGLYRWFTQQLDCRCSEEESKNLPDAPDSTP